MTGGIASSVLCMHIPVDQIIFFLKIRGEKNPPTPKPQKPSSPTQTYVCFFLELQYINSIYGQIVKQAFVMIVHHLIRESTSKLHVLEGSTCKGHV